MLQCIALIKEFCHTGTLVSFITRFTAVIGYKINQFAVLATWLSNNACA